jgi:hypothetical protein
MVGVNASMEQSGAEVLKEVPPCAAWLNLSTKPPSRLLGRLEENSSLAVPNVRHYDFEPVLRVKEF